MARKKKSSSSKGYVAFVVACCLIFSFVWPKLTEKAQPAAEEVEQVESSGEVGASSSTDASGQSKGTKGASKAASDDALNGAISSTDGTNYELPAPLKNRKEQILTHVGYTTSYNSEWKLPNWVAWVLTPDRLVEVVSRSNKFLPDPLLPEDEAVTTSDYSGSGYDRGHMCPAGDNRWRLQAMTESFYMTNMCPQVHNLNAGDWKELEDKCRNWAESEGKIYIVCGPILYNQKHETIGKQHKVIVPEAFFKVILALGKTPKAIGFIYKNTKCNNPLSTYVNTVDEVERITGIDFFPALPDDIENKVEASYDLSLWN